MNKYIRVGRKDECLRAHTCGALLRVVHQPIFRLSSEEKH